MKRRIKFRFSFPANEIIRAGKEITDYFVEHLQSAGFRVRRPWDADEYTHDFKVRVGRKSFWVIIGREPDNGPWMIYSEHSWAWIRQWLGIYDEVEQQRLNQAIDAILSAPKFYEVKWLTENEYKNKIW